MGAKPPYPLTFKGNRGAVLARRFFLCAKGLWAEGRRSRTILNHGGQAPIPLYNNRIVREESMCEEQRLCEHVFSGKMIAGVVCGADRVHGARPAQEVLCTAYGAGMCGGQEMREHALFGKIIFNVACGVDRLHCPCNRMRPPQERVQGYQISSPHHSGATAHVELTDSSIPSFGCGIALRRSDQHRICQHALPDKMTTNIACGADRLHCPCNRMCPAQKVLRTAYGAGMCGGQEMRRACVF